MGRFDCIYLMLIYIYQPLGHGLLHVEPCHPGLHTQLPVVSQLPWIQLHGD
jgi:hypothetical protein